MGETVGADTAASKDDEVEHATPGHEGTSRGCPKCGAVRDKTLGERLHSCPCGLVMPRDQASTIMTVGRALLAFREGPDPGGRVAERRKAARLEGGRKAREKKKQSLQGAWPCASESGPSRNVRSSLPSRVRKFKLTHYPLCGGGIRRRRQLEIPAFRYGPEGALALRLAATSFVKPWTWNLVKDSSGAAWT